MVVLFDKAGSFMIPSGTPELAAIRKLVEKAKHKVPLHRNRGVFEMRNWVPKATPKDSVFARRVP